MKRGEERGRGKQKGRGLAPKEKFLVPPLCSIQCGIYSLRKRILTLVLACGSVDS